MIWTRVILASASPRRRELLKQIFEQFDIIPADIDEGLNISDPRNLVEQLSFRKAHTVVSQLNVRDDALVIGADTIVNFAGKILNKPRDAAEASAMLTGLSGHTHTVFTGITLMCGGKSFTGSDKTNVTFGVIPPNVIAEYVASGQSLDKAGAYGIQDLSGRVEIVTDGDPSNVVGLPLNLLRSMLKNL